jgi:hypothetical protein
MLAHPTLDQLRALKTTAWPMSFWNSSSRMPPGISPTPDGSLLDREIANRTSKRDADPAAHRALAL